MCVYAYVYAHVYMYTYMSTYLFVGTGETGVNEVTKHRRATEPRLQGKRDLCSWDLRTHCPVGTTSAPVSFYAI